jgi:hypothetical protein
MSDVSPIPPAGGDPKGNPAPDAHARWRFLRDVAVFQFKLALDNLRDFALIPVTLIAAAIDLVFKGEREGALFYKVLEWGWHSERVIDLYSVIERDDGPLGHDFTVDAIIARLERVIVREYEKGGTTASVKAAVDRTLDQIQKESGAQRTKAREAVNRAAEKIQARMANRE